MNKKYFIELIKKAAPVNAVFENPSRGTSKIISHAATKIGYKRGVSAMYITYDDLFDVYEKFQNQLVTSSDLKSHNPSVFDSKKNGHSCHCTFLFLVFKSAKLAGTIEGSGVRGNPYRTTIQKHQR